MDKIRVEVNTGALMGKLSANWKRYLPQLTSEIRKDTNEYVRKDRGGLEGSSYTASDLRKGRIVWSTAYARRVYYTGNPSKDIHPLASLLWCEVAKQRHSKKWAKAAEKGVGGL